MDYDDNDFQSQNLHLAGETNNKYPPLLQPYALPKFDFDDTLNGHLRFDSLVETEVFLGIEGNEDSNWIEDFSRGSSGVVFSSSAAESCAISRHNNVWSEATSTESVEMLLKSVGQDEVIAREDTVKKSDTCDEPDCIAEQMEPSETCGEKSFSKQEAANLQPNPLVDETPGEPSVLKEDVGLEQPLIKDALPMAAHELYVEGRNTVLPPETDTGEVAVTVSSHNDPGDAEQKFVEEEKIRTEITECTVDQTEHGVSSDLRMEIDSTDGTVQDNIPSIAELNSQKPLHLKNFNDQNNTSDSMQSSNCNPEDLNRDGRSVSVEAHFDSHVGSSSKFENVEAENVDAMAKADLTPTELSDFPVVERRSQSPAVLEAGGQDVSGSFNDLEAQCQNAHDLEAQRQNAHFSSTHTSSTIETSLDLAGQITSGINAPAEKPELLSHNNLEIVASQCESSLRTVIPAQTHLVETSETVRTLPVDTLDETNKTVRTDEVSEKGDDKEGSVRGPASLEQRTDSALNACNVDHDASSSQVISERTVLESFGNVAGASVSKLAESNSQSISGGISRTIIDGKECQALPLNVDKVEHLINDNVPAATIISSGDLLIPKTASAMSEKGCISESEKASSCQPDNVQILPPAGVCGSESQMDKLASSDNVEDCPGSDGSKEAEPEDAARQTMLQISEGTILEENPDTELKNAPGTELIPKRDSINALPDASSLDNPGAEVKMDGQEDKNNTESADNMKTGIPSLRAEGDTIKLADSSCVSTFSGTSAESCAAGREEAVTDSGNPSTSLFGSKPSELPRSESEKNSITKPEDQSITSFIPAGSQVVKRNDTPSGQMSLTSVTAPLADPSMKPAGEVSQAISSSGALLVSPIVLGSPSTSSLEKTSARTSKGTPERKPRRTSKSAGKETSRKGNAAKETASSRQLRSGGKISGFNQTSPSISQFTQSTEKQQNSHTETPAAKPFGSFSVPTSSLPDLNSSALSSLLQRPFTDLQQVQLRAQIFVYGALIQGTAPDEAYMISAFGGLDGGKGIWEKPWRACVERTQKSHAATPETPVQSRAGPGGLDLLPRTALSGKIATPSVGHTISKEISAVNSIIPLSSPLWSLPTPRDTLQSSSLQRGLATDHQPHLSSLHAHQTPPVKNIVGHNAPWISPTPYRSPWLASPQTSAFDVGTRFSVFPITEAVKLTPMKETSLLHSGAKFLQKDPTVQSGTSSNVVKGTPLIEPKSLVAAPSQHSTEAKPRKRKKIPVSEEPGSSILNSPKQTESFGSPLVTFISASGPFTTIPANLVSDTTGHTNPGSIATAPMNLASMLPKEKPSSSLSSPILSGNLVSGNLEIKQRSVLSEDAVGKLKEATRHAEDASSLAAAAVSHSQYVWKQVDQQKNAGLEPEIQRKLASAAVAIAAAAAVAKAAAAAANVAANAALQAKLMAEEASISNNSDQSNELSKLEGSKILGQATPASILKGDGAPISSSSVLIAAREAAKKRVEAATAATKRAENMDAIVKAAELAAEAVSQAGELVSMGDPLSLNELVEAGPDGYWRRAQLSQDMQLCQRGALEKKETVATSRETSASLGDAHTGLDDPVKMADGVSCSVSANGKKWNGHKGLKAADLVTSEMFLEAGAVPKSSVDTQTESERIIETAKGNGIKEGSSVEVFKEGPGLRTGWYSANVLSLQDGKAYVCYTELSSEQGTDKLKEWVALEGDSDVAPKIRTARSVTAMPFEGTRKRRRTATGDRTWSIGDKVDAWVHDSWWEGVTTEKNKKDETTLTVHFPVQGETLTVKSWNLRPSLVWKDGRWIECSSTGPNISSSHEGDTPNEKRPRLGSPAHEGEGKDTSSKNVDVELGKLPQTGFLELDVSEKSFNIGRSTRDVDKPDSLRIKRTGLQKQGSRVIFGVPKPGKKRKFMEVSKHYVSQPGNKTRQHNEPAKSVKSMIPQSSGSRVWRNTSKSDPRERQTALSKPKIFKPASKLKEKPGAAAKTIAQKDDSQNIAASNLEADVADDQTAEHKGTVSGTPAGIQSSEITEEQTASSSHDTSTIPSLKKTSSSLKAERANKGKLVPAAGKLAKIEEDRVLSENSSKTSDGLEPRRSNRRIQPTSRLLEGLQTSMITSKIPSVSHGKVHQSQSKSNSRGK